MKDLIQIIRKEVMKKLIDKAGSECGNDLTKVNLNIMEIKDVLYSTLMDIEIIEVKDKWEKQ